MRVTLLLCIGVQQASAQHRLRGEKSLRLSAGFVDGMTLRSSDEQYNYYASLE